MKSYIRAPILFGWLLVLQPQIASSQTMALSSATVASGVPALLNLSLANSGAQITAVQWTLEFPAASVTALSVNPSTALSFAGKQISCAAASGTYKCIAYGMNSTVVPDGILGVVSIA